MNKTYSAKPSDVKRDWFILDASEDTLGRVASKAAQLLTGKGKPMYTAHIDCGDYVIITNAENLKVTGNKMESIKYYHHSQYPGGLSTRTLKEQMVKNPAKAIQEAVRGMLPVNKLTADRMNRLKVYIGDTHKHEAQQPLKITLKKGDK